MHTFDVETRVWQLLAPERGPAPSPRAGHAAVVHEGNLYVFGGKDDANQKLNDLWRFNLAERVWTELTVPQDQAHSIPMARSGHTATLYQGYICIFGGLFEVTKELNDLHLYDIANNRWICLFSEKTINVTAQSPTKSMAMG